jgi:hypothetical protein
MRIVVLGYVVRGPLGGMTWHYLHYLLGLSALGHDVYFAEDSDDAPFCYDPSRDATDANPAYGLAYADETFRRLGLESRWAYYDAPRREWKGGGARHIIEICRTADLLLNVSGVNRMRDWFRGIPRRCLVDTDPAFTQIRHRVSPEARAYALEHTCHLSFGSNIGRPGCLVPNDGFSWEPTRQPIALEHWTPGRWRPFRAMPWRRPRFTSVMLWYSYPALDYEGVQYGTKWHSFQAYASLPTVVPAAQLELAAASPRWAWAPPDVQVHDLRRQGWRLRAAWHHPRLLRVPSVYRRLGRGIRRREGRLRRQPERMVQRAKRGVSRRRKAGRCTGHRILGLATDRIGAAGVPRSGRSSRGNRVGCCALRRPPPRCPRHRCRVLRRTTRTDVPPGPRDGVEQHRPGLALSVAPSV